MIDHNQENQSSLALQEHFTRLALEKFKFLIDDYGFRIDATNPLQIKYKKFWMSIGISWNGYAFEIDIDFRNDRSGEKYNLYEVVMALAPREEWQLRCRGADSVKMARCLRHLSELCQRHLQELLTLNATAFEQVRASANEERRRYTLDAQYGPIKDRANLAWERKEWETARILYEEARPGLSSTEARRLEILTNKIDAPSG